MFNKAEIKQFVISTLIGIAYFTTMIMTAVVVLGFFYSIVLIIPTCQ